MITSTIAATLVVFSFFYGKNVGTFSTGKKVSSVLLRMYPSDKSTFMKFYRLLLEDYPEEQRNVLISYISDVYNTKEAFK